MRSVITTELISLRTPSHEKLSCSMSFIGRDIPCKVSMPLGKPAALSSATLMISAIQRLTISSAMLGLLCLGLVFLRGRHHSSVESKPSFIGNRFLIRHRGALS
jgi:hypothetical protein